MYPESLLFSDPWATWASRYPQLCLDIPAFWDRRWRGETSTIPPRVGTFGLPALLLPSRTHYQTDGYLNEYQANLEQLMDAFPEAQLLGLDLSGAYLREANRRLSQAAGILPQLLKGNERGGHALCIKQHAGCDQRVLAP